MESVKWKYLSHRIDMPKLYFSLCAGDSAPLAQKMAAECEAFLEGECVLVQEHETFPPEQIGKTLARCDVLILVLGGGAGSSRSAEGLSNPGQLNERARMEIISAVNQDLLIVPLLVDDAQLPDRKNAPGALKRLMDCKPYRVRTALWFEDLHCLLEDIQEEMDFKREVERKLSQSVQTNYLGPVDSDGKPLPPQKWGAESSDALKLRRVIEAERFNLKEARRKRDRTGEKNALSALGLAFTQLGQVQKAIEYFEEQLVVVREMKNFEEECGLLANLGDACAVSGHIERAKACYEEQLCHADDRGYRSHVASALNGLGFVRVKQNKIPQAIECYSKALTIYRELENHDKELELLVGIGLNYKKLGDLKQTVRFLEQALEISKFLENRKEEARVLIDLAEVNFKLGNCEPIGGYLDRADEILSITEAPWAAPWKQCLATLRKSLNQL